MSRYNHPNRMQVSTKLVLGAAALLAGACAVVAGAAVYDHLRTPPPAVLPLQARDIDGRLRVSWDASPAYVHNASGATLEVLDGGKVQRYPVEPRVVQSGTLDYLRQTEDVVLTLTLHSQGRPGPQGVLRMVSAPPPQQPAAEQAAPEERKRMAANAQRPRANSGRTRRASGRRR